MNTRNTQNKVLFRHGKSRRNSLFGQLFKTFLLLSVCISLSSCFTFGGRVGKGSTTNPVLERIESGETRTGPWRIILPARWQLTSITTQDKNSITVQAFGRSSNMAYRIESFPKRGPVSSENLLSDIKENETSHGSHIKITTVTQGFEKIPVLIAQDDEYTTMYTALNRKNAVDLVSLCLQTKEFTNASVFGPVF